MERAGREVRERSADGPIAAPRAAPAPVWLEDNRPAALAQRRAAQIVHDGPVMTAQRRLAETIQGKFTVGAETYDTDRKDEIKDVPQVQVMMQAPGALAAFLDKLEQQISGELDRRALLETEEYLQQFAQPAQSQRDARGRPDKGRDRDAAEGGRNEKRPGATAGEEAGSHAGKASPRLDPQSMLRSQVEGPIGEGERSGVDLYSGDRLVGCWPGAGRWY